MCGAHVTTKQQRPNHQPNPEPVQGHSKRCLLDSLRLSSQVLMDAGDVSTLLQFFEEVLEQKQHGQRALIRFTRQCGHGMASVIDKVLLGPGLAGTEHVIRTDAS